MRQCILVIQTPSFCDYRSNDKRSKKEGIRIEKQYKGNPVVVTLPDDSNGRAMEELIQTESPLSLMRRVEFKINPMESRKPWHLTHSWPESLLLPDPERHNPSLRLDIPISTNPFALKEKETVEFKIRDTLAVSEVDSFWMEKQLGNIDIRDVRRSDGNYLQRQPFVMHGIDPSLAEIDFESVLRDWKEEKGFKTPINVVMATKIFSIRSGADMVFLLDTEQNATSFWQEVYSHDDYKPLKYSLHPTTRPITDLPQFAGKYRKLGLNTWYDIGATSFCTLTRSEGITVEKYMNVPGKVIKRFHATTSPFTCLNSNTRHEYVPAFVSSDCPKHLIPHKNFGTQLEPSEAVGLPRVIMTLLDGTQSQMLACTQYTKWGKCWVCNPMNGTGKRPPHYPVSVLWNERLQEWLYHGCTFIKQGSGECCEWDCPKRVPGGSCTNEAASQYLSQFIRGGDKMLSRAKLQGVSLYQTWRHVSIVIHAKYGGVPFPKLRLLKELKTRVRLCGYHVDGIVFLGCAATVEIWEQFWQNIQVLFETNTYNKKKSIVRLEFVNCAVLSDEGSMVSPEWFVATASKVITDSARCNPLRLLRMSYCNVTKDDVMELIDRVTRNIEFIPRTDALILDFRGNKEIEICPVTQGELANKVWDTRIGMQAEMKANGTIGVRQMKKMVKYSSRDAMVCMSGCRLECECFENDRVPLIILRLRTKEWKNCGNRKLLARREEDFMCCNLFLDNRNA